MNKQYAVWVTQERITNRLDGAWIYVEAQSEEEAETRAWKIATDNDHSKGGLTEATGWEWEEGEETEEWSEVEVQEVEEVEVDEEEEVES